MQPPLIALSHMSGSSNGLCQEYQESLYPRPSVAGGSVPVRRKGDRPRSSYEEMTPVLNSGARSASTVAYADVHRSHVLSHSFVHIIQQMWRLSLVLYGSAKFGSERARVTEPLGVCRTNKSWFSAPVSLQPCKTKTRLRFTG